MPRRPGQLNERAFLETMRRLEQVGDDRVVRRTLRERGAVDLAGNVIARHVYRLDCGHMEQVHMTPLPTSTVSLYCPSCKRERWIVEHLTAS